MIFNSPNERLVNHCFTTRTSRTGRGLQYTLQVSLMICDSPTVRLVSHCFTTRTNSTSRTGRAKKNITQYQSYQFVYIGQPSTTVLDGILSDRQLYIYYPVALDYRMVIKATVPHAPECTPVPPRSLMSPHPPRSRVYPRPPCSRMSPHPPRSRVFPR